MSPLSMVEPETFCIQPTPHSPNSRLPVIVYRNALQDTAPRNILAVIEPNGWLKGGQWKTYKVPHFHSTSHECYGIIQGSSTYLLGKSPIDSDFDEEGKKVGVKLHVKAGDVFVLPAGITHCSLESEGDYEFVGLYPNDPVDGDLRFDMNDGKASPEETRELLRRCEQVAIPPLDPLYGAGGPLPRLWREAASPK